MWLCTGSPVAGMSGAVVPTADAAACVGLALVCVSVAEAGSTHGEAPVARQTAVTLPAVRPREAGALSGQLITEGTLRALGVTVARCGRHKTQGHVLLVFQVREIPRSILDHSGLTSAAVGPEMKGGRGARVAVPPDHVGATLALAAVWVTHGAERALRVTLALWETRRNTWKGI